jgi:hypothetical protein
MGYANVSEIREGLDRDAIVGEPGTGSEPSDD